MAKDKYDFIQDILTNKRLTPSQKERVLKLTKIEIEKDRIIGSELEDRVYELEKNLTKINNTAFKFSDTNHTTILTNTDRHEEFQRNSDETLSYHDLTTPNLFDTKGNVKLENDITTSNSSANLSSYIKPENLYRALLAFNQNTILNSTCHTIDNDMVESISKSNGDYDFNYHLDLIKIEFTKLTRGFDFTKNMYALIRQYIYGEAPWSTQKITMFWSHSLLKDWANKNPGIYPNPSESFIEDYENEGFKLPESFISGLTGKNVVFYNDFVLFFKSLWHIKSENSLRKLVEKRGVDYKFNIWADVEISDNFSSTINLYTDVDKLLQAYSKLLNLIKTVNKENDINEKPQIMLSFYEDNNDVVFSIHHLNSVWLKSIQSTLDKPFGYSMKPIVEKQINGLCDLYVRAEFGDSEFSEINLWNGNKRASAPVPKGFTGGVEYLLKFKK